MRTRYYFLHMETSMKIYIFMWSMVGFSSFGLQSVLLNLYLVHLGFDAAGIGRLLAVAQICFGLAAIPAGIIGARLGPRTGLMVGTGLVAAGWAVFQLAEGLPGAGMGVVLQAGLVLANMGQATMIVNGAPYLMSITTNEDRFYYLSFQQAIQALVGLIGGFVAGALPGILARIAADGRTDADFYRNALGLIPFGFILAFLALTRARPVRLQVPATAGSDPAPQPARFPRLVFAVYPFIVYLAIVGDFGARTFFNLYLSELGLETQQIGAMFGFNQLAPFIAALALPTLLNRIGTGKAFSAGAILLSGVLVFLSLCTGIGAVGIGFFFMALMSTVLQATRSLFGQEMVAARWRTYISSAGTISMALGSASSSILGGSIIPALGFPSLFRTSAAIVCLAGLVALAFVAVNGKRIVPRYGRKSSELR